LDGWSTYLSKENYSIPNITNQLSIEAWYATEAFSPSTDGDRQPIVSAALISQLDDESGIALSIGPYGRLKFDFFADQTYYQVRSEVGTVKKYEWQHIIASVDLTQQIANIYLNGEIVRTESLDSHQLLNLSSSTFHIARHNEEAFIAGINLIILNGALDEIRLFNDFITPEQALARYQDQQANIEEPNLDIDPYVRHADDYLRPRYHPMPVTAWANESYGLTYYNNKYHMFYQRNPNAPFLHFMHWGHLSSPDLVNWKEEKLALSPDIGWEDFGAWSGTTVFDEAGKPVIFYTGVNTAEAGIGIAYPKDDDLIAWERDMNNPVIDDPPASGFADFRDPYVWEDNGNYYMIVGSGRSGNGSLATFKSTDMLEWSASNTLFQGTDPIKTGFYWEMPSFVKLNDNNDYILTVGPLYSNRGAQSLY
jgi:hypothetical protein